MDNPFGWLVFKTRKSSETSNIERKFEMDCINGHFGYFSEQCGYYWSDNVLGIDEIRNSLSFAVETKERNHSTVFLSKSRVFATNIDIRYAPRFKGSTVFITQLNDWKKTKADSLLATDPSLQKIGLYITESSEELFVFFVNDSAIKYCSVADVRLPFDLFRCLITSSF